MAMEKTNVLSEPVTGRNTFAARKRYHRGFGGHSRRRVTAAVRNRERQVPMEECHLNSLVGLRLPLMDGISQVTFEYYLGEHQSQIFYGGLSIEHPGSATIHVQLGCSIPIDLRDDYCQKDVPSLPCLAVPTHIFRRFRVYRLTSSSSCDLKKLATSLSNDCASPDESDASCPPTGEKLPYVFPLTTPKSGLSLISLRIYYPVQYMQSANDLYPNSGSRKRVHLHPHYDEVVAYQSLLTMPVSEFASRVLKGVAGSMRLTDCSTELPTALHLRPVARINSDQVETQTESSSDPPTRHPTPCPKFLILPVSVYNRITSMKRMLLDGFKSPVCPNIGWCVAVSDEGTETIGDERTPKLPKTPSWARWTGLEEALTSPSWLLSKRDKEEEPEVRLVFVRRQSDDCGEAISPALRKSIFGPARIRRTRLKGTDQLVMKVKQLIAPPNSTPAQSDEKRQATTSPGAMEGLSFRYIWSLDYRSCPVGIGIRDCINMSVSTCRSRRPLPPLLDSGVGVMLVVGAHSSSVTNGSTDEEETGSCGERCHQQQHQRPTRSCLPPQRLEVVDRDLERALQRSLADGRHKHTSSVKQEPSVPLSSETVQRRPRQKRAAYSSNSALEGQNNRKTTTEKAPQRLPSGVKRVRSEVVLSACTDLSSSVRNIGNTWTHRLRSNSPSATSDSGISGSRRKQSKNSQVVNNFRTDGAAPAIEKSSISLGGDGEHHVVVASVDLERANKGLDVAGSVIPKLTLAIGENGCVRLKTKHRLPCQKLLPMTPENGDPYALPSSPPTTHETTSTCGIAATENRSSPDSPVLVPEEEIWPVKNNKSRTLVVPGGSLWTRGKKTAAAAAFSQLVPEHATTTSPSSSSPATSNCLNSLHIGSSLPQSQQAPPPLPLLGMHHQHSVPHIFPTAANPSSTGVPSSVVSLALAASLPSSQQLASTQPLPYSPSAVIPTPLQTTDAALKSTQELGIAGGFDAGPLDRLSAAAQSLPLHLSGSFWNGRSISPMYTRMPLFTRNTFYTLGIFNS
uniref:Arrestin_N domain-containing protein n=1 Tax=Mesocestoides corti TaxID=53468 RepID=A0A5K3EUP1_MESCO